jgi:hypothetical protein
MLPGVALGDLERLATLANGHGIHSAKLQRLADSIVAGVPWPVASERVGVPKAIGENIAFLIQQNISS